MSSAYTNSTFQFAQKFLGKEVGVVFDRPLGSKHPKHGYVYEVSYGYVPGTRAADGEELDAYYIGPTEPLSEAIGTVIAIVHREDDDDDKLVVVPNGEQLSDEAILRAVHFQEQWFKSSIVRG